MITDAQIRADVTILAWRGMTWQEAADYFGTTVERLVKALDEGQVWPNPWL